MDANWLYCSAIGQDSHRFVTDEVWRQKPDRPLILAGVTLPEERPLDGNSDADVILHALTNALSGLTTKNILGSRADALCSRGITDSSVYLALALKDLTDQGGQLIHVSVSVEAQTPRLAPWILLLRERLSELVGLPAGHIGLTATSGEGLTLAGQGQGISVICLVSARYPQPGSI